MSNETDNLAAAGTDNVEPSHYDNPENWDYHDPDEDQDNEAIHEEEGTDDEAVETVAEDETEDAEDTETADDEEGEQTPITATEDAVVQLVDGTTSTVKDLIAGNMRQSDYTRKAQELANGRTQLEADAQRIAGISEAFAQHLAAILPQEPDASLALSDPNKFTAQKAQYDAAMTQVQKLIEIGAQPKQITDQMSDDDHKKLLLDEDAKLVQMFPQAGTKDGRQTFMAKAGSAAQELGFTAQELGAVTDHRMIALAHWAERGMAAEKSKAKAKAKAKKAPPVAKQKPGQGAKKASGNADAMRKLSRSGSMKDALAVDFD